MCGFTWAPGPPRVLQGRGGTGARDRWGGGRHQTSAFTTTPMGPPPGGRPSPRPHARPAGLQGPRHPAMEGPRAASDQCPSEMPLQDTRTEGARVTAPRGPGPCGPRTTSQQWVRRWVPGSLGEASPHSRPGEPAPARRVRLPEQPLSAHRGPPRPPPTPARSQGRASGWRSVPACSPGCRPPWGAGPAPAAGRTGLGPGCPSLRSSDSEGGESGRGTWSRWPVATTRTIL